MAEFLSTWLLGIEASPQLSTLLEASRRPIGDSMAKSSARCSLEKSWGC